MRAIAIVVALGVSIGACVDLFHDTNFESLCDVDAAACAADAGRADVSSPQADAGPPFPADFCAWTAATARANALRACAWLGTCAGPLGDNALGPCLMHAMLAYDCAASPNRPVRGAAHAYWDCLWRANSCGEVADCVEPSTTHASCGQSDHAYAACEGSANASTRLLCDAGAAGATPDALENCAATGRTCALVGSLTACSGSAIACATAGVSCDAANRLHDCDPDAGPFDQGVDCTSYGAGKCAGPACAAVGDAGCTATGDVACEGNVAVGCPSGVRERVDCNAALSDAGKCDPLAPGRAWDVARACSAGACAADDSCAGSVARSCARGVSVDVDCASVGLGGCAVVRFPNDPTPHAACTPRP